MFGSMGNNKNNVNSGKAGGKSTKDTKWGFAFITLYNRDAIERKIKKMAARGWLIEEMQNQIIWTYRRIEPAELNFALVYSRLNFENDPASIEKQRERDELYASDGWHPAADWDTLRVYYNKQPDPVPIETDPMVQVESIYDAMKLLWKYYIFSLVYSVYMLIRIILQCISYPRTWQYVLMVCWIFAAATCALSIAADVRWHKKALQAAEQGVLLPLKRSNIPCVVFASLFVLLVLSLFL